MGSPPSPPVAEERVVRRRADGRRLPHLKKARRVSDMRVDDRDAYRGIRRWPEPARRRLLLGGVLIALTGLILAGLALRLPEELRRPHDALAPDGGAGAQGTTAVVEEPESDPVPGQSAAPDATPPGSAPSQMATVVPEVTKPPRRTGIMPMSAPIRIEAEDTRNSVTGAARRVSYGTASGGVLVRDIGTPPGGSPGALTVPVSVPDAGQYDVLVRIAVPEGSATLTLVVTVSGSIPVAVPVTGRTMCCSNGSVTLGLQLGTNWINFGNPTGPGPAIDFIQITRSGAK